MARSLAQQEEYRVRDAVTGADLRCDIIPIGSRRPCGEVATWRRFWPASKADDEFAAYVCEAHRKGMAWFEDAWLTRIETGAEAS